MWIHYRAEGKIHVSYNTILKGKSHRTHTIKISLVDCFNFLFLFLKIFKLILSLTLTDGNTCTKTNLNGIIFFGPTINYLVVHCTYNEIFSLLFGLIFVCFITFSFQYHISLLMNSKGERIKFLLNYFLVEQFCM